MNDENEVSFCEFETVFEIKQVWTEYLNELQTQIKFKRRSFYIGYLSFICSKVIILILQNEVKSCTKLKLNLAFKYLYN